MDTIIENYSNRNIVMDMRRAGYLMLGEYDEGEKLNFVKKIDIHNYPRFHVYLKTNQENKTLNISLHLDQKKPAYQQARDHGADYEGPRIEQEMERLRSLLK